MGQTIANLIKFTEKTLLVIIAVLTVLATLEEVLKIYNANSVQLADLLDRGMHYLMKCSVAPFLPTQVMLY